MYCGCAIILKAMKAIWRDFGQYKSIGARSSVIQERGDEESFVKRERSGWAVLILVALAVSVSPVMAQEEKVEEKTMERHGVASTLL